MRRAITTLVVALSLGFAGAALARDIADGKLILRITKDGKYQVGDGVIVDKVGMYGAVGSFYQDGVDKGKPLKGLLLKKAEQANDEQKHMIYVTAHNMKPPIPAYQELDGKEVEIVEAAPPPAPVAPATPAQPADAAAPAAPAQPAAPAPAPESVDPNKH